MGLRAVEAVESLETGIHFPVDASWNSEYSQVEELLRRTEWNEATQRLLQLAQRLNQISHGNDSESAGVDKRTFAVPSGGGFAMGAWDALKRLVGLLPDERRNRLQTILDVELRTLWENARSGSPKNREGLRYELLRTHSSSSITLEIAREEIDASLESGSVDRARFACHFLRSHANSSLEDRLKATWTLLEIASHDPDGGRTFSDEHARFEELLAEGRDRGITVSVPDSRARWLRDQLAREEPADKERPNATATAGVVSPLVLGSSVRVSGSQFELGSVQERRPFEFRELWSHLSDRAPASSPVVQPRVLDAQSEDEKTKQEDVPGATDLSSSRGPGVDVSLPFYPVALRERLYVQTYREIVAYNLSNLEEAWSKPLQEGSFEALDSLRSPAVHVDRVLVTTGAQVTAMSSESGEFLWKRAIVYDRLLKSLSINPTDLSTLLLENRIEAKAATEEEELEVADDESLEFAEEEEAEKEEEEDEEQAGLEGQEEENEDIHEDDDSNQPTLLPVQLSPAAVHLDNFVVAASVPVENEVLVYLISLGRHGQTRWSTYLGSVESSNYLGMGSTISIPLVADGTAFVLTNLGYLAAVDVVDGRIHWLQAYDRLTDQGKVQSIRGRRRWQANPMLYRDGLLYMAPQDADSLFCVDVQSGQLTWKFPRSTHTTLLGFQMGNLILGGPSIRSLSIEGENRGEMVWTWEPPNTNLISLGRSSLLKDRVLVSDLNAMYTLDLKTGRELSVALWDFRGGGGNILALPQGYLAVASAGGILLYNDLTRERERVEALRPGSPERLLELAKIELKTDRLERGMELLDEWVSGNFEEPANNSHLDRVLFEISEALRYTVDLQGESSPLAADLLRVLMKVERESHARAVAGFRAAQIYLQRNRPRDAMSTIRDALTLNLSDVSCPVNQFLAIPGRVFAEGIIENIRDSGNEGKAAFTEFEWDAQEELAQSRRLGTQDSFERVVSRFPLTKACGLAQTELANYYQSQRNLKEAVRWLIDYLRAFPGAEDYIEVALRATDIYVELSLYTEARDLLLDLSASHGEQLTAQRNELVRDIVWRRLSDPGFRDIRAPLEGPWLRFPVQLRWRSPANLLTNDRQFLRPEGTTPDVLDGHFLIRSRDLVECRNVHTGLKRWVVEFAMVPTMRVEKRFFANRNPITRFVGDLLVYANTTDVIGIDCNTGLVRWSNPIVPDATVGKASPQDKTNKRRRGAIVGPRGPRTKRPPPTNDRIRGLGASDSNLFVYTHQKRLVVYDLEGFLKWERQLPVSTGANRYGPFYRDGELLFFGESPAELVTYDAQSGDEVHRIQVRDGRTVKLQQPPLFFENHVAITLRNELIVVNLETKEVVSRYADPRTDLQKVQIFEAYPDQLVLAYSKKPGKPMLAGISWSRGEKLWEFRDFQSRRSRRLWMYIDGSNIYVVYGDDKRHLTALNVRPGPERGEYTALKLWPDDAFLGGFFYQGNPNLVLTNEYVIFPNPDSHTISMYDRNEGVRRHLQTEPIRQFLIDKRNKFYCDLIDGRLVFVTNRGDAAFESRFERLDLNADREKTAMLRQYLSNPQSWEVVQWLAFNFFRDQNHEAAVHLLNESLVSEHLPSLDHPGKYQELKFVLDGIKEEALKHTQPEIVCRRFQTPPHIDGELNESWNFTHRVEMRNLTTINQIPSPGEEEDVWKGQEDLSSTLYTGWDETYFYFALDVDDNQIYPYDKEAQYWRGDCLVIGLDPTGDGGMHHRPGDQLLTLALTVPNRKANKDREGEEGEEEEEEEDKNKPEGVYTVKKKEDNSGVIYEVAIPWVLFQEYADDENVRPGEGKFFGLSLVVTDDDSGQGSTKMMSLTPCHLLPREQSAHAIWKHLVPEYFPKVRLK